MNDLLVYSGLLVVVLGLVTLVKPLTFLRLDRRRMGLEIGVLGLSLAVLGGMRSDDGTRSGAALMRIDEFVPVYHFRDVHAVRVHASREEVFEAILGVTPGELGLGSAIVAGIRSLPVWFIRRHEAGHAPSSERSLERPIVKLRPGSAWLVLAEEDDREVVLGFVGHFWRLDYDFERVESPEHFRGFDQPGYAKAALNFHVEDRGDGWCRVTTETRIVTTDEDARRKFGIYWHLIHPGVSIIRRDLLKAIKRRSERAAQQPLKSEVPPKQ